MTTKRPRIVSPFALAAGAALALSAPPRGGHAFEAPKTPACYATAPNWNAANGALVSGISPGVIQLLFQALGQTRTHVMLANNTPDGQMATESTGLVPSIHTIPLKLCVAGFICKTVQIPDPSMPLEPVQVAQGSPGFSQINMGGAYAYWADATQTFRQYKVPITPAELQNPSLCGHACQVEEVANFLWYDAPFTVMTSGADHSSIYYALGSGFDGAGQLIHFSYGFHQYMDGVLRTTYGFPHENAALRGIACSQVPAWGFANWWQGTDLTVTPGTTLIATHQYGHSTTSKAGNALWNAVYQGCMTPTLSTDPWTQLGNVVSVLVNSTVETVTGLNFQDTVCQAAAWQILNCFFQGENSDGTGCRSIASAPWTAYKADRSLAGANSVSPEDIMGLSGAPKSGPWSNFTQASLQWNGGGSTYGCYY